MAERRSLYKKIVLSEPVDQLSNWGQLFFTWSIPHADDVGLLPRSAKMLKGTVFPLKDKITIDQVEAIVKECLKSGLYKEITIQDKDYLWIRNFQEHQTLKRDRQPSVSFNLKYEKKPKDTWEKLDVMVSTGFPNGFQVESEEKRREEKGREGKGRELSAGKPAEKPKKPSKPEVLTEEDKNVNDLIFSFRSVNPNYELLFARKPQREAMRRMLRKFSFEKMKGLIDQVIPVINDDKYFGTPITTPIQLENDLAKVVTWLKRQEKDQKSKVKNIKGLDKFLNNEK